MNLYRRPRGATLRFSVPPRVAGYAAVGGSREGEGPFGNAFAEISEDGLFGEKSWEKAERCMQETALRHAALRSGAPLQDFDFLLSGDLLNQCTPSALAARGAGIPFLGLYGACSTMAEGLLLAACLLDGGFAGRCMAAASSHFCSAERQYRYPLEYGSVRPPTAQWTVTAAGAVALSAEGGSVCIPCATPGRVIDPGITDANNMGAAMAPAACDTIIAHLKNTDTRPEDYDGIFTGDLGRLGRDLLLGLLRRNGVDPGDRLCDCGCLIYNTEERKTHPGGSGCGCSAAVLCTYILPALGAGKLRRVLFLSTGALMSPTSSGQGETVPGIAHLIELRADPSSSVSSR